MHFSYKLQVHLRLFFFSINVNTAIHAASSQHFSILLISMLVSSRISLEILMTFVVISVASTDRELSIECNRRFQQTFQNKSLFFKGLQFVVAHYPIFGS